MEAATPLEKTQRHRLFSRWRQFVDPGRRTWVLTAPIHLIAFLILYIATDRLVERQVISTATASTKAWLEQASGELHFVGRTHSGRAGEEHLFDALLDAHRDINFRLFLPRQRVMGLESPPSREDHDQIVGFLASGAERKIWFHGTGATQEMRGLRRVITDHNCTPCHAPGATLAVASMNFDLAPILGRVKNETRLNLAFLVVSWAIILALTTIVVQISVRRSAARLEADLAAVEAGSGEKQQSDASPLVLDPASARLHESLRGYLQRQRQQQAAVATRLAHTDQLASLGQLAAGLAHEIKNPLAGIQGALEILRQDDPDSANIELYDEMLAELGRVNGTLQSLLTSARPSPPRLARTNLRQLLQEISRLLEPGLRRLGVQLNTETVPGNLEADMDAGKIRQVLINLVQNAAEAMDGNGGIVTLRAGGFPQGGGVMLAVEDDGPGITHDYQAKVFEPFFTTKFSGTGLGLPIARTLVEQHGGSLNFESERGRGTTFFLLIPEITAVEGPDEDQTTPIETEATAD